MASRWRRASGPRAECARIRPAGGHEKVHGQRRRSTKAAWPRGTERRCSFQVFTEKPALAWCQRRTRGGGGGGLDPEEALAALDVADGLQVETLRQRADAAEPVQHRHRCAGPRLGGEIVNYRGHNGKRPEGDRILVLEDTDDDGKADKQTVFYQGTDINSPHGISVLGQPRHRLRRRQGLQPDRRQRRPQSRQGSDVHAASAARSTTTAFTPFISAPTASSISTSATPAHRLKDKDGKPIVDKAGNEVQQQPQALSGRHGLPLQSRRQRMSKRWLELPQQLGSDRRFASAPSGRATTTTTATRACASTT